MKIFAVFLCVCVLGCAESTMVLDGGNDANIDSGDDSSQDASTSAPLQAHVYTDIAGDDRTRRNNGIDDDDLPIEGVTVRVLGTETFLGQTNAEGRVSFEARPGHYFFDTEVNAPTTHNHAPNVLSALKEGNLHITTLGDSLPVVGGTPRFDAVLGSHFSSLGTGVVENNIAVSGSTSVEWMEGTPFFRQAAELAPSTDLFIVSLGGNDFLDYVRNLFATGGMSAVIEALNGAGREEAIRILDRVLGIIAALRQLQPNADFVFLVYANYPDSNNWRSLIQRSAGSFAATAQMLITREYNAIMRLVVDRLQSEPLILTDVLNLTRDEPIDPFLVDQLHFTTFGHRRIGEEMFLSLGGAIVGGNGDLHPTYELGLPN